MIVTVVLLLNNKAITNLPEQKKGGGEGGGGFNGIIIQTHGLCVSAKALYQLSYKDSYIGRRPVCWVQFI